MFETKSTPAVEGHDDLLLDLDFSHSYGSTPILNHIQIGIERQEFLCVVGPSGCGKTTFARIIGGLLRPSIGRCLLNGQPVSPMRDHISMVFQESGLMPWRTVLRNVEFGMEINGVPRHQRRSKAKEMIDFVGLSGFEDHYPYQISGGMKQRASIARSFALESSLVILDEPFVALDAPTREEMQKELLRLWQHERRTAVFVTHSLEEAAILADRIVVFGPRPTSIISDIRVDLDRPRDPTDHKVADLRRMLRELIISSTAVTREQRA